jgi:sugar phosphate isomerase/epimerase
MMEMGIFAKTFSRKNVTEVCQAVQAHNINTVQFNMSCANLPTLPLKYESDTLQNLENAISKTGIKVAAVSGTFNMIHPNTDERELGLLGLGNLACACEYLGTKVITLCTGSRDADNMWKFHPENNDPQAWVDLSRTMERALKIAEKYNVILGIEPELSNVINTAKKAKKLLDTFQSEHLKIIMDGTNLIPINEVDQMHIILDAAFDLLGEDIILAHAKDFSIDKHDFVAAGKGSLDYEYYLSLLKSVNYDGPLIVHGLSEEQVPVSIAFLKTLMR